MFGMKVIMNDYQAVSINKIYAVHKADNRNKIVKIQLNIDEMRLSPLEEKRLIFLLGHRYKKNSRKFKIVSRQCTKFEENMARIMDIFRRLYLKAKRAPIYFLPLISPRERRIFRNKILGKKIDFTIKRGKNKRVE